MVVDAVDGSQFIEVVAFLVNFEVVGSIVAMVVVVGVVVSFVVEAVEGIAVEVVYSFSTVLEQSEYRKKLTCKSIRARCFVFFHFLKEIPNFCIS